LQFIESAGDLIVKRFEWSEVLSVGDDNIDAQHRSLVDNVNDLLVSCKTGDGLARLGEMFVFLEKYLVNHFRDEEALQEKIGFPQIDDHRKEHEDFLQQFYDLKAELGENGPSLALVVKTNGIMLDWLEDHLSGSDRELGRFIMMKR